jgi:hypothetical protein
MDIQGITDLFVWYIMPHINFDKVESLLTTLVLGQHPEKKEEYLTYMNLKIGDMMNREGYAGGKKYIGVLGVSFHVFRLRNTGSHLIEIEKLVKIKIYIHV